MTDWIPGLLLGLGLLVLLGDRTRAGFARRLAPHVRDVARDNAVSESNPVTATLRAFRLMRVTTGASGARRRRRAIDDELPAVLDLLGLCVSAGMSVPAAFERVGSRGVGVLADECRRVTAEVGLGVAVADALRASDARMKHDGWSRLTEHLVSARRQGTPLADTVRFLADDEAQAEGRRLLESASARETMMMFPLVFGILPATVLIAVFPGVTAIGVLI